MDCSILGNTPLTWRFLTWTLRIAKFQVGRNNNDEAVSRQKIVFFVERLDSSELAHLDLNQQTNDWFVLCAMMPG